MADELDDFLNGGAEDTAAADQVADETLAQGDEQPGDDAAAETVEGEGDQPKPKKTAQDRIDELTRARREAEREAAHWKRLAQEGKQPEPQPKPQAAEDAEPDPAQYQYGETDPAYIRALGTFTARQEFQRLSQAQEQQRGVQAVERAWEKQQADFAKDNPDFYEKTSSPDLLITPVMAETIKTSDEGARVAYHLAQHPDEARRIAGLNPLAQVRELGRLEAKLATPPAPPPPQTKTVSDAPPPHPTARGLSGRFAPAPDTDDLDAFERTFFAGR